LIIVNYTNPIVTAMFFVSVLTTVTFATGKDKLRLLRT